MKIGIAVLLLNGVVAAQVKNPVPRCEVVPLPGHQVSLRVHGVEQVRWHFGTQYERPFFFPFNGPSGSTLTRMGHPGAENHDHHRSVWFAHNNVDGSNFWSNRSDARVRQKHWYRYLSGEDEGVMAVRLGWYDKDNVELMDSDVVVALRPMSDDQYTLEIQLICRPPAGKQDVTLGKTNFGFLAVRVAESVSSYFGDGKITNSEGMVGEPNIFGKPARWMDYSGTVPVGVGPDRTTRVEGITYFDHPDNPRYPTHWHVRQDGWMGASFCMHEALVVTADKPLTLRYMLWSHQGACNADAAAKLASEFASRPRFQISKSKLPHRQYQVQRVTPGDQ